MRNILPVVLACHFLAAFTVLGVPLYLPRLLTSFGLSERSLWAGALFSLPAVMTAVSSAWWGRFADRFGRRLSLQRALTGLTLAFVLAGLSPSLPWLIAALALQGVAGGTLAAANGYLSLHLRGEGLAKALNWTQSSARLALLSAPPLMGAILMWQPDIGQHLWLGLAILPLCGLVASLRLPPDPATESPTPETKHKRVKTSFPHLWVIQFLFNFAMVVTFPYFLPYAAHWLHQDILIGVLYSWPHLIYLLLLPLWHRLTGRSVYFVPGMLLMALAALWHLQLNATPALLVARTLFGCGMLLAYSGTNQMLSDSIRQHSAGKQFGQIDAAGKWAGVAAGLAAGWLVTHFSLQAPFLASALAASGAIALFVFSPLRGSGYVRITRRT